MPGRAKNIRRSKQSKIDRYHTVTDKDPITGTLPEEKKEEKKESEN